MNFFYFVIPITNLLFFFSGFSHAADTITQSQSITDGSHGTTLVSNDESFELGFFSPGSSTNRYLGIWYKKIQVKTVVWVANRRDPIKGLSGVLTVNGSGNPVLLYQKRTIVWSANSTKEARNPIVLQLLDSGNLVLRDEKDENPENYLWQSFDYPSDTLLPGMKLGWDLRTGLERRLSAWKSSDDPSPGDLSWGIELHNYPETFMKKGPETYFRTGPWNGVSYSGAPELKANPVFDFNFVSNKDEVYFIYHMIKKSVISRLVLNQTLSLYQRFIWIEANKSWIQYASVPKDNCDKYNLCGGYGNCILNESPICQCLEGFKPKSTEYTWNPESWSQGCQRSKQLSSCQDKQKDGFVKHVGLKLPDTTNSWVNERLNLKECRVKCLSNCSCMAYTISDIRGEGSGCAIWYGELLDIRQFPANGQDLYIRMSASESELKDKQKMKVIVILIVAAAICVVFGMLLIAYCIHKSRTKYFRGEFGCKACLDESTTESLWSSPSVTRPHSRPKGVATKLLGRSLTDSWSQPRLDKKATEGLGGSTYSARLQPVSKWCSNRVTVSSGQLQPTSGWCYS